MSYSLESKCDGCKKKDTCTDRHFLYGAICGIHQTDVQKTHLGSGTVDLNCQRFEEAE